MKVLLIGSGGREHALAWKIAQSPLLDTLYAAPGNPGIAEHATLVSLNVEDHAAVIAFAKEKAIDFVIVGPEAPLVAGLADDLRDAGIATFGPSKAAAAPIVIKADGLAAGKGVTVAMTEAEALSAIDDCFDGAFGAAGAEVVVEAFLDGEEASFFCLSDGKTALALATAQDHKRVGDGDTGPNTGGMGAYSPAPVMTADMVDRTMKEIIEPTIHGMAKDGHPFSGVFFAGLMITKKGPELIEYNVRFGDPECQVLMMRLKSDLLPILYATATGTLDKVTAEWIDDTALTVVLASKGYPAAYEKNTPIVAIPQADEGAKVFHAGTALKDGQLVATGGRVLNVTATGKTASEAKRRAYDLLSKVEWDNGFCRKDIGWLAIAREQG